MKTLSTFLTIIILLFACSGDDKVPQLNPQEVEQMPEMVQETIDELLADGCPDTEYPV